jgi:dTMP kinase
VNGLFLVLEGIDGSGTTTQAKLLATRLASAGHRVVLTREPTSGPVGRFLRQALAGVLVDDGQSVELGWDAMALLFSADRMDHVRREIRPALESGMIVVSDRYDLSSLIYQSATCPDGPAALEWLRALNGKARRPDLTLVLDVDANAAAARRAQRDDQPEIYEKADLQRRLRDLYKEARNIAPYDEIEVISGEGTMNEVEARVVETLLRHSEFGKIVSAGG